MSLPILFDARGAIATITLNAPEKHNALTPEMVCRLADSITAFGADPALRVAIITGAGDRAFCAGGDLARTLPLLTGAIAPADDWDCRLLAEPGVVAAAGLVDGTLHKPVIAAVNGVCMAAGFEMLLGTDLRLAADHATFALPEVKHGLMPFAGALVRLPRQIAYCRAMEIVLTGDTLSAGDALQLGLVNRVLPGPDLLPAALALAERIASNGPLAVSTVKRVIVESSGRPLDDGYRIEREGMRSVMASDDAREGPRAFVEKRPPRFHGR
jgi:enoyl-CoA hydratase